ncbi:hypothetical protein FACS189473_5660 [Spirochaetia bacterium]|nr:hypothetical protein FACS189473_5660 [Spirochaetia bacterium]
MKKLIALTLLLSAAFALYAGDGKVAEKGDTWYIRFAVFADYDLRCTVSAISRFSPFPYAS